MGETQWCSTESVQAYTYHCDAVQSADVLKISTENLASRIDVQMSSSLQSQMAENKHILCQIVWAVLYLAKQDLAFRGDKEDVHSQNNPGNFLALL